MFRRKKREETRAYEAHLEAHRPTEAEVQEAMELLRADAAKWIPNTRDARTDINRDSVVPLHELRRRAVPSHFVEVDAALDAFAKELGF